MKNLRKGFEDFSLIVFFMGLFLDFVTVVVKFECDCDLHSPDVFDLFSSVPFVYLVFWEIFEAVSEFPHEFVN